MILGFLGKFPRKKSFQKKKEADQVVKSVKERVVNGVRKNIISRFLSSNGTMNMCAIPETLRTETIVVM